MILKAKQKRIGTMPMKNLVEGISILIRLQIFLQLLQDGKQIAKKKHKSISFITIFTDFVLDFTRQSISDLSNVDNFSTNSILTFQNLPPEKPSSSLVNRETKILSKACRVFIIVKHKEKGTEQNLCLVNQKPH